MRKMKAESVAALVRIDAQLREGPQAQRTADTRPVVPEESAEASLPRRRAV
jgi:hypothetical protein